jgi:hypothetical protein
MFDKRIDTVRFKFVIGQRMLRSGLILQIISFYRPAASLRLRFDDQFVAFYHDCFDPIPKSRFLIVFL